MSRSRRITTITVLAVVCWSCVTKQGILQWGYLTGQRYIHYSTARPKTCMETIDLLHFRVTISHWHNIAIWQHLILQVQKTLRIRVIGSKYRIFCYFGVCLFTKFLISLVRLSIGTMWVSTTYECCRFCKTLYRLA